MTVTLKIETLDEYTGDGEIAWYEKDDLMLHACFQLLTDFWEIEYPTFPFVLTKEYDELKQLYNWWLKRPERQLPDIDIPDDYMIYKPITLSNGDEAYEFLGWNKEKYPEVAAIDEEQGRLIEQWDKEDQKNLERLIQLRGLLWT